MSRSTGAGQGCDHRVTGANHLDLLGLGEPVGGTHKLTAAGTRSRDTDHYVLREDVIKRVN
jgi:hypothetical protein